MYDEDVQSTSCVEHHLVYGLQRDVQNLRIVSCGIRILGRKMIPYGSGDCKRVIETPSSDDECSRVEPQQER